MKNIIIAFTLALTANFAVAQTPTLQEGMRQLENENYKSALDIFNAIAKSDSRNCKVYYYIGQVSYVQDDAVEAEKAYKKGLTIDPNCAECKVGLGQLKLDQGKTSEADELFESAKRLDKKNHNIYGMVGDAYLYSKHPNADKAVENLTMARDMKLQEAKYWAHLGDAYKLKGDNGTAMTNYETAVQKDPNNTAAYISMARIWKAAQLYDEAISKLKDAIKLSPNDALPYKELYELYIKKNDFQSVLPILEKYIELIGTDVDAQVRLVKFLTFQANDYNRAIEKGEPLLRSNPDQYTLHRWLAWSYFELGKYKESYDHSKKLFEDIGKNEERKAYASDYEYWAKAALELGKLDKNATGMIDEAAHVYRKFIELEPDKADEIYGTLAKAYYDAKVYEQAAAYYTRKAEISPLSNAQNYYLGYSYYRTDKDVAADSLFAKVIEATPDFSSAWLYRANIANASDTLKVNGDFKMQGLAQPYYEQYIKLYTAELQKDSTKAKANLIAAYNYMTIYYVQVKEDYNAAKEQNQKALELDPTNEVALKNKEGLKGTR